MCSPWTHKETKWASWESRVVADDVVVVVDGVEAFREADGNTVAGSAEPWDNTVAKDAEDSNTPAYEEEADHGGVPTKEGVRAAGTDGGVGRDNVAASGAAMSGARSKTAERNPVEGPALAFLPSFLHSNCSVKLNWS